MYRLSKQITVQYVSFMINQMEPEEGEPTLMSSGCTGGPFINCTELPGIGWELQGASRHSPCTICPVFGGSSGVYNQPMFNCRRKEADMCLAELISPNPTCQR